MGVGNRPVILALRESAWDGPGWKGSDEESIIMSMSLSMSMGGFDCCRCCISSESDSVGVIVEGGIVAAVAAAAGKPGGPGHRFCVGEVRRGRDCRRFYS